ncbi:MAG: hypothetical protein NC111_00610 [Bacteroides sp.]|nr:hypothetical protein [Bacteroides sp.]MCM1471019.1 hypothetical protein [Bacteroides sp.]
MYEVINDKALSVIDSGLTKASVKQHLSVDPEYRELARNGVKLDSAGLFYINTNNDIRLQLFYDSVASRIYQKASKTGLLKTT